MPDEPVYRITLVRHGESTGNACGRLQGHADYPLSGRGRAQVIALARRWKAEAVTFDHVIASPLSRALETARIIAAGLQIANPEIDPRWIERDAGERTGVSGDETRRLDRETDGTDGTDACGSMAESAESDEALYSRGELALRSILERPPARYLVSSHRAILNMVVHAILGIDRPSGDAARRTLFRLPNGSVSRFRYFPLDQRWQVDVIGDRSHWNGEA